METDNDHDLIINARDDLSHLDGDDDDDEEEEREEEEEEEEFQSASTAAAAGEEQKPPPRFDWSKPPTDISHRQKLIEILKNLCSLEIQVYSDASKAFVNLLKRDVAGGEILCEYARSSPNCAELAGAWKLHCGKPGMAHIISLITSILDHPEGKAHASGILRILDRFARSVIESRLDDVYTELSSQEFRRQSAALRLLACIVRRGAGLAREVEQRFDFKLAVLPKLSGVRKRKAGKEERCGGGKRSLRNAFVEFAVSFLEVGSPGLLWRILQQRVLYYEVLRGLGSDEVGTVVHVLATIRDRVLTPDSLVNPGLRSVLFGSVTLEQLAYVSGNPMMGPAADIAHAVLLMVCTDPSNGLMPGPGQRGNRDRLFELMKKLKATEVRYHRDLLLAIASQSQPLGADYMDEFPYHLEPRSSSMWFSAISLAADMIGSINTNAFINSLASRSHDLPDMSSDVVKSMLKCIIPRSFTRSVINKGLLHSDILVKHGSLRVLLESLKSLDSLLKVIDDKMESISVEQVVNNYEEGFTSLCGPSRFNFSINITKSLEANNVISDPHADKLWKDKWVYLKQCIQNEVRAVLPDLQVLLKLLSSSSCNSLEHPGMSLKRCAQLAEHGSKKLKPCIVDNNIDIIVGGIVIGKGADHTDDTSENSKKDHSTFTKQDLELEKYHTTTIAEIWDLDEQMLKISEGKAAEKFFHSKLLDVLKFFLRTMPAALDGSFDFFRILPENPLSFTIDQQISLLSVLVEYVGESPRNSIAARAPDFMYRHLQPLLYFMLFSQNKSVLNQAYTLARTAMISTGAFDENFAEIDAWFFSLPGYIMKNQYVENQGAEAFHKLAAVVISFLCDAVSTVGNSFYKYLDHMRNLLTNMDSSGDDSPGFSVLIVCVLQKCLRLLESDSGAFKLYEKSVISLYVCNTLILILQMQVDMKTLPALIHLILNENFKNLPPVNEDDKSCPCEWRPLKKLFHFVHDILHKETLYFMSVTNNGDPLSLSSVLTKVKEFLGQCNGGELFGLATAFSSSVLCATSNDILENFPQLITLAHILLGSHIQCLPSVLFLDHNFLANVANLWPHMFCSGLEMSVSTINDNCNDNSAFGFFLKHAPFYVLFSAILSTGSSIADSSKMHRTKLLDLIQLNISECSVNDSILFLRHVLFWTYQIILHYRANPSNALEELFQLSFSLTQYIFKNLLVKIADAAGPKLIDASNIAYIQEVVDLIFQHPTITLSLSHPLKYSKKHEDESLGDGLEAFLDLSKKIADPMNHCILQFLKKVMDFLLGSESGHSYGSKILKPVLKVPRQLFNKLILLFKKDFEHCIRMGDLRDLLPSFNAIHALMPFMSPFELLEAVHWMFGKLEDNSVGCAYPLLFVSVSLYVADVALDMLFSYIRQTNLSSKFYLLDMEIKSSDSAILQDIYWKILDIAISSNLELADICLSKAVNAVYILRYSKPPPALLQFHMLLSRMVVNSPMKLLVHCFCPTSKIKAKLLLQLVEVSPIHLSLFGKTFLGEANKYLSLEDAASFGDSLSVEAELRNENSIHLFSVDDFLLLLPIALKFLTVNLYKLLKPDLKICRMISTFYSKILLGDITNWKRFISKRIFLEDYSELESTSSEGLQNLFHNSLLGKTVHMLHYFFLASGSSLKKKQRLKLFESIYPQSLISNDNELFGRELTGIDASSSRESIKLANEVAAKISLTRLLLFPPENDNNFVIMGVDEGSNEIYGKKVSDRLNGARLRFMNILVNALEQLDRSPTFCSAGGYYVFRFLEHLILRNIVQLSREIQGYLSELPSIVFLSKLIKSSILHRFEDPVRLKALRCILITLSDERLSSAEILELLLTHSHFFPTILCNISFNESYSNFTGALQQPVPSILKSVGIFSAHGNPIDSRSICDVHSKLGYNPCALHNRKSELIKLLRVLYHFKGKQHSTLTARDFSMEGRDLISKILCGYGATMSITDLEILHLMYEIESIEGLECIAELDYLWGDSALKLREELASGKTDDTETIEELRKRLFRENIPVDSKLCAMTVSHFCSERSSKMAPISLKRLLQDYSMADEEEVLCSNMDIAQQYDPAFVLRFSIHSLLMGYIEPVEFARMGLLAITLISISSADEEIRKLGYESLGNFKKALENIRNAKDVLQLKLLLTYLQNGITEAWQRIPSVIAIFAAEASFILVDPSRNHFLTISKFLLRSPKVNLKAVPLFNTLFGSGSVHFNSDRLWILQLLYAGLNSTDDAKIYRQNNIFELILSFYSSSLSDPESRILILQIIKKSVKLRVLAHYLVKNCGILLTLSTVFSSRSGKLGVVPEVELVLKVINDVITSRMITEWLQESALEQLSALSAYLHGLLVGSSRLLRENVSLVNSILNVIISTLRISQKRKIYQPHFTISLHGLVQLFKALDTKSSRSECNLTIELGINLILMSTPVPIVSHQDRARLLRLVVWAIPTALKSFHNHNKELFSGVLFTLEEKQCEELLVSKLLRWLSASVILGGILEKYPSSSSGTKTLQSLLENVIQKEERSTDSDVFAVEELTAIMLYLQQLLGRNCSNLVSNITALCLLLLSIFPVTKGKEFLDANRGSVEFLCTKIRCPPEANPSWRWSYYQPWKDLSVDQTEVEEMEEKHACQSLLIIFSEALGGKPQGTTFLHQDVEHSGLFEWERSIMLETGT